MQANARQSKHEHIFTSDVFTNTIRPFNAKPSGDLLFIKLWAALNKRQKWKKHVENIKMAKFESPGIDE